MCRRVIILLALIMLLNVPAYAQRFIPLDPIMPVSELKAGMNGYMLTVLKGMEISRVPVKIVSVIPQKPSKIYRELILVKLIGRKLAQGMSGSPVYVQGKLIGAIRSGWQNSDHTLALVMPIESMCEIHEYDEIPSKAITLSPITLTGLSVNTSAMIELSQKLGVNFVQGLTSGNTEVTSSPRLRPGDSVSAMLVWGDVELSAAGVVTAVDKYGRFLAFGHDFLKRGKASYPSGGAYVHDIVDSTSFPVKLASTQGINGTITQDRENGIAGRFGYYAPSVAGEFIFRDLDRGTEDKYKFRMIADEFLTDELLEGVCKGLAEESWGRKGQGTMSINLRIDGKNVPKGFARKDIFFSDKNIIDEAFKQVKIITSAYLSQPFAEIMPAGFRVTAEVTQNPKVLLIEDVETVTDAKPGESVDVKVTLRGWRTEPITRKFTLKIPDDASGVVEMIVRGGGTQSMGQAGINGGWKTITSLERMLTEFRAADANNQLIIELNADRTGDLISKIKNARKKGAKSTKKKEDREPDLLPEEEEYLSETKERRIREGTLKIFSSDYYVDGLMRRVIHTEN